MMMNKIASFICVFALTMISSMAYRQFNALEFKEYFLELNIFKGLGLLIYFLFPRTEFLSESSALILAQNKELLMNGLAANMVHLIVMIGIYFVLANLIVKKKDF
jgi:hypothetical protein